MNPTTSCENNNLSHKKTQWSPPTQTRDDKEIHFLQFCTFIFLNRDVDMKCECALALSKGKGSLCVWTLTITAGRDSLRSKTKVSHVFFKAAFFKQSKNCLLDLNVVSNIKNKKKSNQQTIVKFISAKIWTSGDVWYFQILACQLSKKTCFVSQDCILDQIK